MQKRYFTVEEANRLVPSLQDSFARVIQTRALLKTVYKRLDDKGMAPEDEDFSIPVPGAPSEVVRDRATFKALVETLREELTHVQATGCLIKDVETGLVDWLARKNGRDILLCWRYGEKEVSYWHDLESGFAGRRPVSELVD